MNGVERATTVGDGPPLRLALTVDPERPVPPRHYGGIERIVDMLVRGLLERGHDVTLFCHPDSSVPCRIEPYPGRHSRSKVGLLSNMWAVSSGIGQGGYDLVHSFGRLAYLAPLLPRSLPKLMSYQRTITSRSVRWSDLAARGSLHFAGCSRFLIAAHAGKPNWHVVYNCAAADAYELRERVGADAPLVFLGRIEAIKGAHVAVDTALRSGRRLVIAGNVPSEAEHQAYFRNRIAPHVDGVKVQYVGEVDDGEKNRLLGAAAALLFPVLWDEPFGIVMAEALACGTPVVALARGAVPEVIQSGVNGFACASPEEMVAAVGRIGEIDRRACRRTMEEKFSDRAMVDAYETLYRRLVHDRSVSS